MNDASVEFERLATLLNGWDRHRRRREALAAFPRGLLAGLLLAALLATAARLFPFLTGRELGLLALSLAAVGGFAAMAIPLLRRHDLAAQARFADRQFGLRERLSTAVELQQGSTRTFPGLAERQVRDAREIAATVDVARALTMRPEPRDWLLVVLGAILVMLAFLLPNPQEERLIAERAIEQAVRQQTEELRDLLETIETAPELAPEEREALGEPLAAALEELEAGRLTQEEAVAALSEAERSLRVLAEQSGTELLEGLASAGAALGDEPLTSDLGSALQRGDVGAAASAIEQLAQQASTLTPQEAAALASRLDGAAAALSGSNAELARQLTEAAAALEGGEMAEAAQPLREAAAALEARGEGEELATTAQSAADAVADAREAVADAGAAPAGADAAQTGATDEDTAEAGAASGAAAGSQPGDPGAGSNGLSSPDSASSAPGGRPAPGGGHVESVYVPPAAAFENEAGIPIELPAHCRDNPAACGPQLGESPTPLRDEASDIPYTQVYADYRDAAFRALEAATVPLGLKALVRDYFRALEP